MTGIEGLQCWQYTVALTHIVCRRVIPKPAKHCRGFHSGRVPWRTGLVGAVRIELIIEVEGRYREGAVRPCHAGLSARHQKSRHRLIRLCRGTRYRAYLKEACDR